MLYIYILTIFTTARLAGCCRTVLSPILQLTYLRCGKVKCPGQGCIIRGGVGMAGLRWSVCSVCWSYCFPIAPGDTQVWGSGVKKVTQETHHQAAQRNAVSVTLSVLQSGTARWQPSHPSLGRAPPELCLRGRVGERAQILQILYEESGEAPVSLAFRLAFIFDHSWTNLETCVLWCPMC